MPLNPNSSIGGNLLLSLNYLYKKSLSIGVEFKAIDMIGLNEKIDAYLFLYYPRMGNKSEVSNEVLEYANMFDIDRYHANFNRNIN
jgi:hypothetical protein